VEKRGLMYRGEGGRREEKGREEVGRRRKEGEEGGGGKKRVERERREEKGERRKERREREKGESLENSGAPSESLIVTDLIRRFTLVLVINWHTATQGGRARGKSTRVPILLRYKHKRNMS